MRKLLRFLLKKPLTWLASFSGSPDREAVFKSLDRLMNKVPKAGKKSRIIKVIEFDAEKDRFIVFSDQHKGNGDGGDDFRFSEQNYIQALKHYQQQEFTFINLGDSEELWKYKPTEVVEACKEVFKAEAAFQYHNRHIKVFGNHDLLWKDRMSVGYLLKDSFSMPLPVWEAILLKTVIKGNLLSILLTHGHQGDKLSDNNALSTWFVAHIWAPIQRYIGVNVNTPGTKAALRNKHNHIMYDWSSKQKNLLLVTGHTHQPVFASGYYSDHPANQVNKSELSPLVPSYFNSGCCCFSDGDITGIEIADGNIRLVKWYDDPAGTHCKVLEEVQLETLARDLSL